MEIQKKRNKINHLDSDNLNNNNQNAINDNNNNCILIEDTDESVDEVMLEYDPDLSMEENPYYYEANKILHNLHMDRVKRSN